MIERIHKHLNLGPQVFYDPHSPIRKWRSNLPHWEQDGKIYFVTIRCADSIPDEIYQRHIQEFKAINANEERKNISDYEVIRLERLAKIIDKYNDQCYGECLFTNPQIRDILQKSLQASDGIKYELYDYVIMPNHLHFLILPTLGISLKEIISTIKRQSAFHINQYLGRRGKLWQRDYFDRMPRDITDLYSIQEYIYHNPNSLPENSYHLCICE